MALARVVGIFAALSSGCAGKAIDTSADEQSPCRTGIVCDGGRLRGVGIAMGNVEDGGRDGAPAQAGRPCPRGQVRIGGACTSLGIAEACKTLPSTQFAGDSQCLEAPDPARGMQLHYGPKSYDDPAELSKFVVQPNEEVVDCMFMKTPNAAPMHVNDLHVRVRPGGYEMITYSQPSAVPDSTAPEPCGQGSAFAPWVMSPGVDLDLTLDGGASEYAGAAMAIDARTQVVIQMHVVNRTDQPELKEAWLDAVYVDPASVKLEVSPSTWMGGLGMNIPPHREMLVQGGVAAATQIAACTVTDAQGDLDVMTLIGRTASHTTRMAAYIERANGARETLYEAYDWEHPALLYYNGAVQNPLADPTTLTTGGTSGDVVAHPGDRISWECAVTNDTDAISLRFSDLALDGEVCNVYGMVAPSRTPWSCISL
ncbi:MAG TPA: hypothetical protein VF395_12320 [Polyangiaceae bacterium]